MELGDVIECNLLFRISLVCRGVRGWRQVAYSYLTAALNLHPHLPGLQPPKQPAAEQLPAGQKSFRKVVLDMRGTL